MRPARPGREHLRGVAAHQRLFVVEQRGPLVDVPLAASPSAVGQLALLQPVEKKDDKDGAAAAEGDSSDEKASKADLEAAPFPTSDSLQTGQEKGATLANFKPLLSRSVSTRFG